MQQIQFPKLCFNEVFLSYKRHPSNHILTTIFFFREKKTSLVLITKESLNFTFDLKVRFIFSSFMLEGIVDIYRTSGSSLYNGDKKKGLCSQADALKH